MRSRSATDQPILQPHRRIPPRLCAPFPQITQPLARISIPTGCPLFLHSVRTRNPLEEHELSVCRILEAAFRHRRSRSDHPVRTRSVLSHLKVTAERRPRRSRRLSAARTAIGWSRQTVLPMARPKIVQPPRPTFSHVSFGPACAPEAPFRLTRLLPPRIRAIPEYGQIVGRTLSSSTCARSG